MCYVMAAVVGLRRVRARRPRRLWAHERRMGDPAFFDQNLLGLFNAKELKARMRMDVSTFEYLCSTLTSSLQIQNTNMRSAILLQVKVAVATSDWPEVMPCKPYLICIELAFQPANSGSHPVHLCN